MFAMLLDEYRRELAQFDWEYDMSDSHAVWKDGLQRQSALYAKAMELGPEAVELYLDCVEARAKERGQGA